MNVVAVALGQEVGPYKVIRADAALSVVRDVDDESNPTEWRIRVLSPVRSDIVARFVEENRALRTLQVPVLAVVDANSYMTLASNQRRNTIAYVVYACSGRARPLAEYLVRGPIPPDDASEIVRRIAHALAASHESQLVHGSLSPQTVMVRPWRRGRRDPPDRFRAGAVGHADARSDPRRARTRKSRVRDARRHERR